MDSQLIKELTMKIVTLNLIFLTTACLKTSFAFSCQTTGSFQHLNYWVCDFQDEMILRDLEADHLRKAEIVSSTPEIRKIRAGFSHSGDETCRNFNQNSLVSQFQRILQHQSLPRSLLSQKAEFAAAEILNESSRGTVDVCESQHLSSLGQDHTYQNLYYFKFGPVRENKHILIKVTTQWQH